MINVILITYLVIAFTKFILLTPSIRSNAKFLCCNLDEEISFPKMVIMVVFSYVFVALLWPRVMKTEGLCFLHTNLLMMELKVNY